MSGHFIHTSAAAERWDHIAYRYYGDANRTHELIAANRALFPDAIPAILPPATVLTVPVLAPDEQAHDLLPPWKRGQA